MNLSTAQAGKRAKEVGLRKVIGAVPRQLFRQFMGESFITVVVAAIFAVVVAALVIPSFNELTGKSLSLNLLDVKIISIFIGLILVTSLLAGAYPAIFIADFKPVQVLKGQLKSGKRASVFRKTLVVVQFVLSIFLIVSTIVVYRQMDYMQTRDIGFVRENLFYSWMQGDMASHYETIRTRLLQNPAVESVTSSDQTPIQVGNSTGGISWQGKDPNFQLLFSNMRVDFDFAQTLQMTIVEGRAFDRNIASDSVSFIVNEKAAEKMGFTDGTAGKELEVQGRKGKLVGVVKDFNFQSLHAPIDPFIMAVDAKPQFGDIIVRAKEGRSAEAIAALETLAKEYAPQYPYHYSFINQDWDNYYKAEGQRGQVFNVLSGLSIIISCLGLFGLSAYSAERRIKELGIRKVMGATVPALLRLMATEFTILVIIAAAIGCPVAWYAMNLWLEGYAFHISVGWLTLAVATLICLFVSLGTILYHSLKATMTNPAISLRYE